MCVDDSQGAFSYFPGLAARLEAGFDYWQGATGATGVSLSIHVETKTATADCAHDGSPVVMDNVGGEVGYVPADLSYIAVNPYTMNTLDSDARGYLGAHEMGHFLGLDDAPRTDCGAFTVMTSPLPSGASIPGDPGCADLTGLTNEYHGDQTSSEYQDWGSSREEDCWDTYEAVSFYWIDDNDVTHYSGTALFYVETHCGPPQY